jgi:hypothetical protein
VSAPGPLCGACESELRQVHGKWVCLQSGCPRYGEEQLVLCPKPDAPPGDKVRLEGTGAR